MNCRLCLKLRSLVSREVSSRIRTGSPYVVLPHHWSRPYSVASGNDVLQPPSSTGSAKVYSAKIKQLVDDISKLTVLEISDLNDLLKTTLNITEVAAPVASASTSAAAVPESTEDSPVEQQTEFTIQLTGFADGTKAKVIKEIKSIMEGMNLVQAKKFVEDTPQIVKKDISKEEAEGIKKSLETAGATVQIE
ncbi:large ribosomal subunit protein bL12m-like isoform X2 [Corticium candelabrum]|uniref:large ribosomal subunit protein bL12m-like isoform X2 n=1 Tax=Corticium candelabrum TaxID=121492 RepID=UPI002E3696D3|nr:large ribosomal subunit protein bL12m-like isoform X2 [Corticium candelabrum]